MANEGTSAYDIAKSSLLGGYFATTTTLQAVYAAEIAVIFSVLTGKVTVPTAVSLSYLIPPIVLSAPIVGASLPLLYYSGKWAVSGNHQDKSVSLEPAKKIETKVISEVDLGFFDMADEFDDDIVVIGTKP